MRWLIVHPGPSFSVHDVHAGWTEALRDLGQQVFVYNLDERLSVFDAALFETGKTGPNGELGLRKAFDHEQAITLAIHGMLGACYQIWPDIVFIVSAFFVPTQLLDLLRLRGHKVIALFTESPYQDQAQLNRAAHVDLALLNDPTNLGRFRQVTRAEYVPHSYRPKVHHPGPPDPNLTSDFAFVGTGYPSRIAFLEAMDLNGLEVLLAGNWQALDDDSPLRKWVGHDLGECADNTQAASIYRSTRASINIYRREADQPELAAGYAMGPREVELAATGCFFLRDPRPESGQVLGMLPTFTGPEDAAERLRWWLRHEGFRATAAAKAREAIKDWTFINRARRLLQLLDRQPVTT